VIDVTGWSSTTTAMSWGSLCCWPNSGSPWNVPAYTGSPSWYAVEKVTRTRSSPPSSQWAAVRTTVGLISVAEQ
jgi:hypothetical protein